MSNKWGWAPVCAAAAGLIFFVGSASAQQGRRGSGMLGRGSIIQLSGAEAVQKELGVESEAKEKISALISEYREEFGSEMRKLGGGGFRDASEEEQRKMKAKMQETSQKLNAKYVPKLKEILKDEQFNRLQQISWQASGAGAFSDPELVKTLELSKEQQDSIAAVNREYFQKQRGLFGAGGGGGNIQEALAKVRELNQERDKKAEEVLSKPQQEKFKELKGKPFDLSQLNQGRPGGGKSKDNN